MRGEIQSPIFMPRACRHYLLMLLSSLIVLTLNFFQKNLQEGYYAIPGQGKKTVF